MPPVGRPVRPTVVVFNAGAVVRVRLDRKATSAGAGECRRRIDKLLDEGGAFRDLTASAILGDRDLLIENFGQQGSKLLPGLQAAGGFRDWPFLKRARSGGAPSQRTSTSG